MTRSPGFGSNTSNFVALLKLAFAAPTPIGLSLLDTLSRWPIMQKVRHQAYIALWLIVSIRFQVLFHSPFGVLFTFPSQYWCTIGRLGVLSLGRWSSHVQTGFLGPRPTLVQLNFLPVPDYHCLRSTFPCCSGSLWVVSWLVRFRSPLLSESRLISFPSGT